MQKTGKPRAPKLTLGDATTKESTNNSKKTLTEQARKKVENNEKTIYN